MLLNFDLEKKKTRSQTLKAVIEMLFLIQFLNLRLRQNGIFFSDEMILEFREKIRFESSINKRKGYLVQNMSHHKENTIYL